MFGCVHTAQVVRIMAFKIMEAENQGLLDNGGIGVNTKYLLVEQ